LARKTLPSRPRGQWRTTQDNILVLGEGQTGGTGYRPHIVCPERGPGRSTVSPHRLQVDVDERVKEMRHIEMPKAAPQKSICHFQKLEMILK